MVEQPWPNADALREVDCGEGEGTDEDSHLVERLEREERRASPELTGERLAAPVA
jgi:hypothetical protein